MRKRYPRREFLQQAIRRYRHWTPEQLEQHTAALAGRLLAAHIVMETKSPLPILAKPTVKALEFVYEAYVPQETYE